MEPEDVRRSSVPAHLVVGLKWTEPCEEMFEYLADSEPTRLIQIISSCTLEPHDLTFAAEQLGRIEPALARPVLLGLLAHPSPVVREGAVYGLANHMDEVVASALRDVAQNDLSPGVRMAASGVLEEV